MEATNISIKQQSSVSINIETWAATLQDALQAIKQRINIGALTLPRLYRKELKVARAICRAIEKQKAVSNGIMAAMVAWYIYYVFIYY